MAKIHVHLRFELNDGSGDPAQPQDRPEGRFNVLLTEDRDHGPEHWTRQMPRLLEPLGIATYRARTGRQAMDVAAQRPIHAAVIDMATPFDDHNPTQAFAAAIHPDSGMWLLDLMRRLPHRPPIVLLQKPALSRQQAERALREALKLGVYTVVDKPIGIEELLGVFRRLLDRQYRGLWPGGGPPQPDPSSQ